MALVVKNPPAKEGDIRDAGLRRSGRSLGGGHATLFDILAWRIPWTEQPGGLPSPGSRRVGYDWSSLAGWALSAVTPHEAVLRVSLNYLGEITRYRCPGRTP